MYDCSERAREHFLVVSLPLSTLFRVFAFVTKSNKTNAVKINLLRFFFRKKKHPEETTKLIRMTSKAEQTQNERKNDNNVYNGVDCFRMD